MEPVKFLASGLTLKESKAKRQEKQAARYRHRLGTYVPSGDSKGLLEALMATSPRKSPTPRKSTASESTRPRKSVKSSTKGKGGDEMAEESTQETEKQTKSRESTSRKSIKVADSSEKVTRAEQSEKKASRRSVSKAGVNATEDGGENQPKPSTSRLTDKSTNASNSKATKASKSAKTKKPKLSKAPLRNTDVEGDFDDRPITPSPVQRKFKTSSTKLQPTKTNDESDGVAIKKAKTTKKVNRRKARATEPPLETFESTGSDVDLGGSLPGPSNLRHLSAEEKSLGDAPPDMDEKATTPGISRVVPNRRDGSEEEQQQQHRKPLPKKRGRPHKDEGEEGPPPKRGKTQKADNGGEGNDSARPKPKRQAKSPPKPESAATKGKTKKKADPPPDMSDVEKEESLPTETKASGSNTRKRQRREPDDRSENEKRDEPDGDEPSSKPNRVRLDSIPPEGMVIRKKNGIVERLLPPVIKPKRKGASNRGKTRSSRKRAIPAHVLKYIGPNRIGSPLKAEGTDTDDDLNL
ncbi:hypothetical protein BDM02DRAFT_3268542 [Thelephora ganbajun]|uniref:Uncharacterized protein n=1 Tax=Thelephora ganbajun TaxID=370292 RepID=A0ACB6ZJL3_THEGA|nr:hypothetical protein BDM02DRAFT_3268542 [Thelephora ganbajun]